MNRASCQTADVERFHKVKCFCLLLQKGNMAFLFIFMSMFYVSLLLFCFLTLICPFSPLKHNAVIYSFINPPKNSPNCLPMSKKLLSPQHSLDHCLSHFPLQLMSPFGYLSFSVHLHSLSRCMNALCFYFPLFFHPQHHSQPLSVQCFPPDHKPGSLMSSCQALRHHLSSPCLAVTCLLTIIRERTQAHRQLCVHT